MKHGICWIVLAALCMGLVGCASDEKTQKPVYRKKIYLTEQDYLDDLAEDPNAERREAKPSIESEYIFNVQPETQKNVYFFDERVRPMIPGVPSDKEYKITRRLWKKPRRFTPDQYYGTTDTGNSGSSSSDDSSSYYSDGDSDY